MGAYLSTFFSREKQYSVYEINLEKIEVKIRGCDVRPQGCSCLIAALLHRCRNCRSYVELHDLRRLERVL